MDIAKVLLRGHSRRSMLQAAHYVNGNAGRFAELVKVFLSGPHRVSQRAAWPLRHCVERQPRLFHRHLRQIIAHAQKPGVTPAVKRNTLRLLRHGQIPARHQGNVASFALACLQAPGEPVAMKAFATYVLGRLAEDHPDLRPEVRAAIEDQLPYQSAAFTVAARKVLKTMDAACTHGLKYT